MTGKISIPFEYINCTIFNDEELLKRKLALFIKIGYNEVRDAPVLFDKVIPWRHSIRTLAFKLQSFQPLPFLFQASEQLQDTSAQKLIDNFIIDWKSNYREPNSIELSGNWTNSDTQENDFLWYDMAVGLRALRLGYYLDNVISADELTKSQINIWMKILDDHRLYLSKDETFAGHTNHGFYQAIGQVAMARRFIEWDGMQDLYDQGVYRLTQMIKDQFFEEGIHKEHSPGYNFMVYKDFRELLKSGILSDDLNFSLLNKFETNFAWFILPHKKIAAIGDTDYAYLMASKLKHEQVVNPHLKYILSDGSKGAPPQNTLQTFAQSGYAIVRSLKTKRHPVNSYLIQHAGYHSNTHKHADHLSFIWYDKDVDILVDAGRYGYRGKTEQGSQLWLDGFWYSDPKRVYVESTMAHNCIQVDGLNHERRKVKPFGSGLKRSLETTDGVCVIESEVRYQKTVIHSRSLIIKPGHFLIVVDWLKDNKQENLHDYLQWFHLNPDLQLMQENDLLVGKLKDTEIVYISPLINGSALTNVAHGQTEPFLSGWVSDDRGGKLNPNWAFAYGIKQSNAACYATLFSLNKCVVQTDLNEVSASGRSARLSWQDDSHEYKIQFKRPSTGDLDLKYTAKVKKS